MTEQQEKSKLMKPLRTVREVMDEEYMTHGDGDGKIWTREELENHHRIGDLIAELMAEGYEGKSFDAELKRRMSQAGLLEAEGIKAAPRTAQRGGVGKSR